MGSGRPGRGERKGKQTKIEFRHILCLCLTTDHLYDFHSTISVPQAFAPWTIRHSRFAHTRGRFTPGRCCANRRRGIDFLFLALNSNLTPIFDHF